MYKRGIPKVTAQRIAIGFLVLAAFDMFAGQKTLAMICAVVAIAIGGGISFSAQRARTAKTAERDRLVADREAVARFQRGAGACVAGVVHIGDGAAGVAAKMRVGFGDRFVEGRAFARDVEFEHVPEFVQPREPAMDRGEADAGTQFAGSHVDILGAGMAARAVLVYNVQDQAIIAREPGG